MSACDFQGQSRHQLHSAAISSLILSASLVMGLIFMCGVANAAEPARSSEARAAMGAIKDRLVREHERAGRLDPSWTLADLGFNPSDFDGDYYDASNFGIQVESVHPPVALIVCRAHFPYQLDNCARVDLTARSFSFTEAAAPLGVGESIWPSHKRFNAALQSEFDQKARREWFWPALVVIACLLGFTLAWANSRRRGYKSRLPLSISGALAAGGLVAFLIAGWFRLIGWSAREAACPLLSSAIELIALPSIAVALLLFALSTRHKPSNAEARP